MELSTSLDQRVGDRVGLRSAEASRRLARFTKKCCGFEPHGRVVTHSIENTVESGVEQPCSEFLGGQVVAAGGVGCCNPEVAQDGAVGEVSDVDPVRNGEFGETPPVDLHLRHSSDPTEHLDICGQRLEPEIANPKPITVASREGIESP
jgi:hypothetical protein